LTKTPLARPVLSPPGRRACQELAARIITGEYWAMGCPRDAHLPTWQPPPPALVGYPTPLGVINVVSPDNQRTRRHRRRHRTRRLW
jgi:hypothetical protein